MNFEDFRAKTKDSDKFSQIDTLGSYDFFTSIISFESLKLKDIESIKKLQNNINNKLLTAAQYFSLSKVLPLAAHEYTHFIDSTSTLWGLQHLSLMNEAYLSNDKIGGQEINFYKAKKFHDHVRRIRLPKYYTVITDGESVSQEWMSQISVGKAFSGDGKLSERSILFSRFSNGKGELLARSPISIISILEASAMAQEMLLHIAILNKSEKDFKVVEKINFLKSSLAHIYNKELTEYSVCVHILANTLGCKDILSGFTACALLTRLVLNFPKKSFDVILKKCSISEVLKIPKGYQSEIAILNGIKHYDLGTIFFLLCNALPKNSYQSEKNMKGGIKFALQKLGVDLESVLINSKNEAKILYDSIAGTSIESIAKLAKAGYKNFEYTNFKEIMLDFSKMHVPSALLGDSNSVSIYTSKENMLNNFDIDKSFNELYQGQSWVCRFTEACV